MGHSHSSSSSHKRLRSVSSSKNYGECTEVVDLEFSDATVCNEPESPKNKLNNASTEETPKLSPTQIDKYPKDLMVLESRVKEIERSIENMPPDEFFVYFPTLKDDLHNCWQKVYSVKDQNLETKLRKYKVIDNIRVLLRKLNSRLQKRGFERSNLTR